LFFQANKVWIRTCFIVPFV